MFHVVINPAAGHGQAQDFVRRQVIPLLDKLDQPYRIWTTTAPKHAGTIAQEISQLQYQTAAGDPVKLIVAGGDGTAHELIEGVLDRVNAGSPTVKWELVILPLGTANALHASLFSQGDRTVPDSLKEFVSPDPDVSKSLSSLYAALDPQVAPRRLPITTTTLADSESNTAESPIYSHIVTSTSLHAALLQTSEELRAEHPGLERFKLAAERNLGVFFPARLKLLPPPRSAVKQYDPKTQTFIQPYTTDAEGVLEGPFTYLLSTTICERLEPAFVIHPTIRTIPADQEDGTMDVVVLRPLRDPEVQGAQVEMRPEKWKKRAMEVIGHAYKEGGHIDLTYPSEGGETVSHGEGAVAVETFRVGGFEWTPTDSSHAPSHLVCADGAIHVVPPGGYARVQVESKTRMTSSFWVWV